MIFQSITILSINIDLYPVALKYYPFMISLDKCNGSCNVLPLKTRVQKETKDINVKVFNMVANKNEDKTMTKYILSNSKCKFVSTKIEFQSKME